MYMHVHVHVHVNIFPPPTGRWLKLRIISLGWPEMDRRSVTKFSPDYRELLVGGRTYPLPSRNRGLRGLRAGLSDAEASKTSSRDAQSCAQSSLSGRSAESERFRPSARSASPANLRKTAAACISRGRH